VEEQQVETTTRDGIRRVLYLQALASSSDEEVEVVELVFQRFLRLQTSYSTLLRPTNTYADPCVLLAAHQLAFLPPFPLPSLLPSMQTRSQGGKATASAPPQRQQTPPLLPPPIRALIYAQIDPLEMLSLFDLARLCRVSKADLAIARPILYSVAVIYDQRVSVMRGLNSMMRSMALRGKGAKEDDSDEDETDEDEDDEWGVRWMADRRSRGMLKTVRKHPHLANLVKSLVFYGQYETGAASVIVRQFLSACQNLKKIRALSLEPQPKSDWGGWGGGETNEFVGDDGFELLDVLQEKQSSIESLALRRMTSSNVEGFYYSLQYLKNLRSLSLSVDEESEWNADLYLNTYNTPPSPTFSLQHLDISRQVEPPLFNFFASSSSASLTSLSVAIRAESLDLSPFIALRHLAIAYCRGSVVVKTLSKVSASLVSLELRESRSMGMDDAAQQKSESEDGGSDEEYDSDFDEEEVKRLKKRRAEKAAKQAKENKASSFKTLLSRLPKSLVSLSLPFYLPDGKTGEMASFADDDYGALLSAIKRSTFLPRLQHLAVWDARNDEHYHTEGAESGDVSENAKEEKSFLGKQWRKLERTCEERGVQLRSVRYWTDWEMDEGKIMRVFT
jgi:hypothetical protein